MKQWRKLMRQQLTDLIGLGYWHEAAQHALLYNAVPCWQRRG